MSKHVVQHEVNIRLNDIRLEFIRTGERTLTSGKLTRTRTLPETIVAQCLQGQYEIRTQDRTISVNPGEVALIGSDVPFTNIHHLDKNGAMSSRWIHCRFTIFNNIDFSSLLDIPLKISGTQAEQVGILIGELQSFAHGPNSLLDSIRTNELAFKILYILCEVSKPRFTNFYDIRYSKRLVPVFDYINDNLSASISAKDLAKTAHMSLSRFFPYFKSQMQQSPMGYVKKTRITQACRMLVTTEWSISAIAERVGFSNQFHFSRVFKEICGETPSTYRSQLANAQYLTSDNLG
ncbi:MAG: AraC family transcriptional regulator [Candidatus Latescibacterota bacterium]|nr:AraC family transcriptional regulator [Candidatus Latescibacterota bacterium]